jgi:hypothetical protein
MSTRTITQLTVLQMLAVLGSATAAEWGTIKGRFVFDGQAPAAKKIAQSTADCANHPLVDESLTVAADGSVANVVVYLRTEKVDLHPDYAKSAGDKIPLDNTKCRFEPHVVVLRTSQTLLVKNSDNFGHNTKVDPANPGNTAINPILPGGGTIEHKLTVQETLPVKVGCNIHPWMGAWIVVRGNPYAVASNAKGEFEIKDLPAGKELEFQLWQEKSGFLKNVSVQGAAGGKADTKGRVKLKVAPGVTDLGTIKLPATLFNK